MPEGVEQRDFFISFNSADLAYAEAIDAALRADGFSTFYHPRDLPPGGNIPIWMDDALMNSAQTLALYSPAYTSDKAIYSKAERYASWWQDPVSDKRKLIPIVLHKTAITPLISMISYIDVSGRTPQQAGAIVVQQLVQPGESQLRDAWRGSSAGQAFNIPYRPNANFTGRFEALDSLQKILRAGSNAAITAVAGMGGIGKTTLAAEYCHRFRWKYAGVWWVRAEQEPTMLADLAALGERLGLAPSGNVEKDARAVLERLGCVTEPWLMVYDNAPNPDAVRQWLPVGAVRAIITSRFTEFGELAPVTRVDQWPDAVTAEYLLTRTERNDADGAARLAKILGGLPLAAEQAAAFLGLRDGFSFDEYATEISSLINEPRPPGAKGDYPDTVYAAFVKSLDAVRGMPGGEIGLDLLRLCAFLSPDGVDLALLTVERGNKVFPPVFAATMVNKLARERSLAALKSLSLVRREDGPAGPMLMFHRLLLEVVGDWMGEEARALWGSAAVRLVNMAFPGSNIPLTDTSSWPLCARLMPHVAPLDAHAPRAGEAGRALDRLLNQTGLYLAARGDRSGALDLAEKSVALARATAEADPLGLATSLNNLGNHLIGLDWLDKAETAFSEALQIRERLPVPDDPGLAVTLSNLSQVHWKRREFDQAEPLFLRAAEVMKAAHGPGSAEYGIALSNLDALYGDWADEPGQEARREQEIDYSTRALAITRKARGERHPETGTRYHNLAVTKANTGDWPGAAGHEERAVAIMLSLDLAQHPHAQSAAGALARYWEKFGEADKAARLRRGDISDLMPVIAQIEREHRAWVAEDPQNRHFGLPPPSRYEAPKLPEPTEAEQMMELFERLAAAGIDVDDLIRRIKAGEVSEDDIAKLIAETIGNKKG